MNGRRDFLKLFGVGAVVAPVIGGLATNVGAQARIIEPPKIEIIEPPRLEVVEDLPYGKIMRIDVNILDDTGARYHFNCSAISHSIEFRGRSDGTAKITMEMIGDRLPHIVRAR